MPSVWIELVNEFHDFSRSIFHVHFFRVQYQLYMYQLNQSPLLTQPNNSSLTTHTHYLLSLDSIELSLIPYSLFLTPFNYLDPDFFNFTSTWNMVKEIPNHILENMIG